MAWLTELLQLVYLLRKLATILVVEWPVGTWTESWVQWKARKPLAQTRDQCYRGSNRFNLLSYWYLHHVLNGIYNACLNRGCTLVRKAPESFRRRNWHQNGLLDPSEMKKASEATPWPPKQMQAAGVIISLYQKARSEASHRDPSCYRRLKSCG